MAFEIVQAAIPELAEGLDELGDVLHCSGRQPARAALRVAAMLDQAGGLEDLEMLRDGRLAEREGGGEFRHGSFAEREARQHRTASGIAERGEGGAEPV